MMLLIPPHSFMNIKTGLRHVISEEGWVQLSPLFTTRRQAQTSHPLLSQPGRQSGIQLL